MKPQVASLLTALALSWTALSPAQESYLQDPLLQRISHNSLGLDDPPHQRPPGFAHPSLSPGVQDRFPAPYRPPRPMMSSADSVLEAWVARYNGTGKGGDVAYDLAIDTDGNVYVTGTSYSDSLSDDYVTIKYDATGLEQWVNRYNGPGNSYDAAYAIAIDASANVYVTGESYVDNLSDDYVTIKYNASGLEQWVNRYNGPGNSGDAAYAIAIDASGNVYVTGESYGSDDDYLDYATIKYDAWGVEQWVARYDGPWYEGDDGACDLAIDTNGNVYVTGYSWSGTSYDYVTIKYDSSGVEQWVNRYDGPGGNSSDFPSAIAIDADGNVYVAGYSGIFLEEDYATIKYNASGVEQWMNRYNGLGDGSDDAFALAVDAEGNVYVAGHSWSGTSYDFVTIKYDASGVERWMNRYNGLGDGSDDAFALAVDAEGNVYVTGHSWSGTSYDFVTIKYDASGVERWVAHYDGPGSEEDSAFNLAIDTEGNVCVTGYSTGNGTFVDYTTIKYIQLPSTVALLSPINDAIVTSDSVTLLWSPSAPSVDRYWVEGSTDSLFSMPFIDSTIIESQYTVSPLHHNQSFWWKVKAHNSGGWGKFSEVRSFFVYQEIPAPPVLLSPDSGVTGIETSPTVRWNASVGTESYGLELSDMPDFSNLIVDEDSIGATFHEVADLSNNTTYYWRVNAANALGASDWSIIWAFTTLVTGVSSEEIIPTDFTLSQNYPNPFNPSTVIRYGLPERAHVKLEMFNMLGQRVALLVDGEQEAGYHQVIVENASLASGVYLYRLSVVPLARRDLVPREGDGQAGHFTETKRLMLLR